MPCTFLTAAQPSRHDLAGMLALMGAAQPSLATMSSRTCVDSLGGCPPKTFCSSPADPTDCFTKGSTAASGEARCRASNCSKEIA